MLNNLLQMQIKTTLGRVIQKTELTGHFIVNKISDKTTRVSKTSPQINSEAVEINGESKGTYFANSNNKFKTLMIRSNPVIIEMHT